MRPEPLYCRRVEGDVRVDPHQLGEAVAERVGGDLVAALVDGRIAADPADRVPLPLQRPERVVAGRLDVAPDWHEDDAACRVHVGLDGASGRRGRRDRRLRAGPVAERGGQLAEFLVQDRAVGREDVFQRRRPAVVGVDVGRLARERPAEIALDLGILAPYQGLVADDQAADLGMILQEARRHPAPVGREAPHRDRLIGPILVPAPPPRRPRGERAPGVIRVADQEEELRPGE